MIVCLGSGPGRLPDSDGILLVRQGSVNETGATCVFPTKPSIPARLTHMAGVLRLELLLVHSLRLCYC